MKSQLGELGSKGKEAVADDDDDVPELVGTFEDAGKKWEPTILSSFLNE